MVNAMNGTQIEHLLELIDKNIDASMAKLYPEILEYLQTHSEELVNQIAENGFGEIKTQAGSMRISKEDLQAAA